MMSTGNFTWQKKGSIGILTITNPPGNLIRDPEFIGREDYIKLTDDPDLKGIIISGAGRHFSAGADLDELKRLAKDENELIAGLSEGRRLLRDIQLTAIPVVAAIRGACFGAGLEIALACHVRICSSNSLFAFPEINHGLIPGLGGSALLADRSGEGRSLEIILSGDIIDAPKALELKITDYIIPSGEPVDFAVKFLDDLTLDRDPEVIRYVMRSIHNSVSLSFEEALTEETKLFCRLARKNPDEQI